MSHEGRRRLRIYLGAAAGVGKTCAMLGEAHRRAGRGTDVVVGFAETHGRRHTAEPIRGLEVVPRARLPYRDTWFGEMDLGAVLARRPDVALAGELAHTSVPGSRHAKRWEDVEELLAARIDVISTVNIQQLESLNDVVGKITGVRQQETIPDAVVRAADQIELGDMMADRGPGVPEADRERMFVPFQRLGDTDNTTGVGLGLALSRGLAEAMGGSPGPEETPGGGLTMVAALPVAEDGGPAAPGLRERGGGWQTGAAPAPSARGERPGRRAPGRLEG